MNIYQFLEKYSEKTLTTEAIKISSSSLRNYLNANKEEFSNNGIVKFVKKINSVRIEIIKEDELYKKLV